MSPFAEAPNSRTTCTIKALKLVTIWVYRSDVPARALAFWWAVFLDSCLSDSRLLASCLLDSCLSDSRLSVSCLSDSCLSDSCLLASRLSDSCLLRVAGLWVVGRWVVGLWVVGLWVVGHWVVGLWVVGLWVAGHRGGCPAGGFCT
jgi:hypothetical protein